MLTLALLAGIWSTTCIQTQVSNNNQGFAKETYTFTKNGVYEFKREWFRDANCSEPNGTDTETGSVVLGNKISSFFITQDTFEADFNSQGGIDLGAIAIANNKLKIARGMRNSSMRNTMLGLFEYSKQD